MKRTSSIHTGGGASLDQQRSERKNRQAAEKFFTKKKRGVQPKAGVSEKEQPSDAELLILGIKRLVALALNTKEPASRLAGKILAYVDALIAADREKLCEANEAYRPRQNAVANILKLYRNGAVSLIGWLDVILPASPSASHAAADIRQLCRRPEGSAA